jgi:hypothetical protein
VGPRALPRHARPLAVGRWAARIAERGLARLPADAEAARPDARHDPLLDPLAVTEHCVIGDQIRLPAAYCDIVGCEAAFADPAALGEADNRARALVAGWRADDFGRLVCPACQQRDGLTRPRISGPEPDTGAGPTPTGVPPGPRDGSPRDGGSPRGGSPSARARSLSAQAKAAGSRGVVSHGRHRMAGWLHVLRALASGNNGWSVTQPFTGLPLERNDAGRSRPDRSPPSAR